MPAAMRLRSSNRKLPALPQVDELPLDDPRHWAALFHAARCRKRWTYITLATLAGVSLPATIRACTKSGVSGHTALKLALALELTLPSTPHVVTAHEAHYGR